MVTYKSESNVKPHEWVIDVDTVYHNYNIVESKLTKEGIEEETTIYTYDVDQYALQEYTTKQLAQNTQSIDDIVVSMLGE